jgi:hypothetical protein
MPAIRCPWRVVASVNAHYDETVADSTFSVKVDFFRPRIGGQSLS